jgi:hypothetical protein
MQSLIVQPFHTIAHVRYRGPDIDNISDFFPSNYDIEICEGDGASICERNVNEIVIATTDAVTSKDHDMVLAFKWHLVHLGMELV